MIQIPLSQLIGSIFSLFPDHFLPTYQLLQLALMPPLSGVTYQEVHQLASPITRNSKPAIKPFKEKVELPLEVQPGVESRGASLPLLGQLRGLLPHELGLKKVYDINISPRAQRSQRKYQSSDNPRKYDLWPSGEKLIFQQ